MGCRLCSYIHEDSVYDDILSCACVFFPTDGAILQQQHNEGYFFVCLTLVPRSTAIEDYLLHTAVAASVH